jgi:hypothetical protein
LEGTKGGGVKRQRSLEKLVRKTGLVGGGGGEEKALRYVLNIFLSLGLGLELEWEWLDLNLLAWVGKGRWIIGSGKIG